MQAEWKNQKTNGFFFSLRQKPNEGLFEREREIETGKSLGKKKHFPRTLFDIYSHYYYQRMQRSFIDFGLSSLLPFVRPNRVDVEV